jgi:hypothetical protein
VLFEFLAKVVVLDGEDVDGPGVGFARGPVVVAFGAEFCFAGFQLAGLLAELQLGVRDAEACAASSVEEIFEIDVLVGQLVALQPGIGGEGDDGQLA